MFEDMRQHDILCSGSSSIGVGTRPDVFYRTLIAMAGHDLRRPLQVIFSVNSLLSRRSLGIAEREYLAKSQDAGLQVIKQLDGLIEALQVHERGQGISPRPVSLELLFDKLRREHAVAAQNSGLRFQVVRSRAIVMSDMFLLEGILRNLIGNAIKYTPRGGKILVGCRRSPAGFRIEVHDSGIGIAPQNMSKIFEAFARLDSSASEGLGLGLFIVRHAAASLGHSVDVRSIEGRGSCFAVGVSSAAMPS
jgi:signal transduction histidine kinase